MLEFRLMLQLLMSALLAAQGAQQIGMITGTVLAPPQQVISTPVQVILLSPQYLELWQGEVQKRLDLYWQQYQPTFRNRKELFTEFSRQAHRDATNQILTRMRREESHASSEYLMLTSDDGKFEFKNIPFGEYKILALGKIGQQDVIWQDLIDVRSTIPYFLELKKRIP